jgi:hypothetical protein
MAFLLILILSVLYVRVLSNNKCNSFLNCVSCTAAKYSSSKLQCEWDQVQKLCNALSKSKHSNVYRFDDTCPVIRNVADNFLQNWMGELIDVGNFPQLTLLDISLPGTHDTLTYDLSTRVSDGGADDQIVFAELMHKFGKIVPDAIGDFIREQAQTQGLTVTQQLDNGIRFLDLRTMYEYSDKRNPEWYSLHFMQSNKRMLSYFQEIKDWMIKHPTEIVVMWLSKHGNGSAIGEDQYPKVSIKTKQKFWKNIESIFNGLLLSGNDSSIPPIRINETTIEHMVKRNARAIFYVTDYDEMTGSSIQALDGKLIDNNLGPSIDDENNAVLWEQKMFTRSTLQKFKDKKDQKLFLMSLSTGVPTAQVVAQGEIRFLHHGNEDANTIDEKILMKKCVESFNIPGNKWCPPNLLAIAQLENYYKQMTLEQVFEYKDLGWSFPNAIYINGVDEDGTIRTGTQVMWADDSVKTNDESSHATTKYSYVDTIVAFNLFLACNDDVIHDYDTIKGKKCQDLKKVTDARRAVHPVQRWDDNFGRKSDWPKIPSRET